jgi:hypothetical protein
MPIENHGHEYEFEPQYGLPERLPQGERIVWQVSPDTAALAREAFHFRKLALYFAVLIVTRAAPEVSAGSGVTAVLLSLKWLVPLSLIAMASVWALAAMTARTTVYTLTNKRLVMRLGIVLTVTFNLPLKKIAAADLRRQSGGFGDISVALSGEDHIAWVHLWPSVRPWHLARPQPTVRCVANAPVLAGQLSEVWTAQTGLAAQAAAASAANTPPAGNSNGAPANMQTSPV